MQTKFIEATNVSVGGDPFNWGKFLVGRFTDDEWARGSAVTGYWERWRQRSLLQERGWTQKHLLVLDLQTGEGAIFLPGGMARADLHKHALWVCPLFEPLLEWLYKQDLSDLDALPSEVTLTFEDAPPSMAGHRRPGPKGAT